MRWMVQAVHGPLSPEQFVIINPLLMAGWVGIFITALNLTPIGQLDGGHILYCLIGKRAHVVAVLFVWLVAGYMVVTQYWAFSVMLILIMIMGIRHPPTANDEAPLGWGRIVLGWLTLAFLVIGINPRPIDQYEPPPAQQPVELKDKR
jgi:membrane-associated protease RseP (regulator of RpoE activity)